ncbi:MAG: hypothetical protein ICV71_03455 [Thermoleophilia bacterium]|nr:hypothetical protein [Thermoleophilia bacterium]
MRLEPEGRTPEERGSREWLLRCEGFRVDGPEGLVGIVVRVVYEHSTRWDRPSALAVRGASGEVLVPIDAVEHVDPVEGRISVRGRGTRRASR